MTACVAINASGEYLIPLIILKNKKSTKGLEMFSNVHFASSKSGWMNKRIFFWYCILLVIEISLYRIKLPHELRDKWILLILDGHNSRLSFYSMLLLWMFKIQCLLLPGHCTHVLQPFDVGIASPLKVNYKSILNLQKFEKFYNLKQTQQELREMMISSFIGALHRACSPNNIKSAFKASGISPIDPGEPLAKKYVIPEAIEKPKSNGFGGKIINNIDMLEVLFEKENFRKMNDNDLSLSWEKLIDLVKIHRNQKLDGFGLTKLPDLIIGLDDGRIICKSLE